MKILLVEDEPAMSRVIRRGLEQADYVVDTAEDGLSGLRMAIEGDYALLVLDLMLPKMDGWRVCEELRSRRKQMPILMLTARGTVQDRVKGLDLGADDYLPKPFEFSELLARVRAQLRRDRVHRSRVIKIDNLKVDTGERRVFRAEDEIFLTPREYDLLEALASREGQVLTREVIQERIWRDDDAFSNTVDVCVCALRKKIDSTGNVPLIHTIRGVGYSLRRGRGEGEK